MEPCLMLSDREWARIEPLLPSSAGRRGHPFRDHRQVVEGIVYRLRVGMPWRELPAQFGPWQTVWKRHRRFCTDGTLIQILACLQADADLVAQLTRPAELPADPTAHADRIVLPEGSTHRCTPQ